MILPARAGTKSIVVMPAEWTKDLSHAEAPRVTSCAGGGVGQVGFLDW